MFIAKPKMNGRVIEYAGCFIELKKDRNELYTKKNEIKGSRHIQEQVRMLKSLDESGYYATFACGFDEAKEVVDWYLSST